jgi:hypothetical protein
MKGVYKYIMLKELKLIIQFYQGDITLDGLINLKKEVLQDKSYNSDYGLLGDFRLSNILLNMDEVEEYGNWLKKNSIRNNLNIIITSTPHQTVKTVIFGLNKKLINYHFETCSTLEHSLKHLNVELKNLKKVETEIEKMIVLSKINTFF